jgi:hypothetical protein
MQDKRPPMKERPIKKALQVNRLRFSAGVVVAAFAEKNLPDSTAQHPR